MDFGKGKTDLVSQNLVDFKMSASKNMSFSHVYLNLRSTWNALNV